MNTNRNSYKLDSPSNNKELYNNSGSNSYHHYNNQPSMNYNNWYTDSCTQHTVSQREDVPSGNKQDDAACCSCFSFHSTARLPSYANDNTRSATNVIASYGVYGTAASNEDDDDGFVPRSAGNYRYHQSVVNVTGNATSTNVLRQAAVGDRTCCVASWCTTRRSCCSAQQDDSAVPAATETRCCSNWCKPTILLLLLVLLVVVFVLISGILLYFNCTY
jgi:hypothetical protein